MKKKAALGVTTALGAGALLVTGCAVPVPLQVASWALDGISLITTEKSVTDHGISIVAQQDCSIWRGVTEGDVCRQWDGEATSLIAEAAGAKRVGAGEAARPSDNRIGFAVAAKSDIPPLAIELDEGLPNVEELANFETAAGPADSTPRPVTVTRPLAAMNAATPAKPAPVLKPAAKPAHRVIAKAYTQRVVAKLPERQLASLTRTVAPRAVAPKRLAMGNSEPDAGVYFVIGSFRNHANASEFAGRFEALIPEVLAAKLDGAPVYRVVVGPVPEGNERTVHRRISRAGLADTWAIRVTPGDWMIARAVIERNRQARSGGGWAVAELAGLSR